MNFFKKLFLLCSNIIYHKIAVTTAKIAHDIKLKQDELEKTKQEYAKIKSQVNEEKAKFSEAAKIKKIIKRQEQDLIKAKEKRLRLINVFSKEKELISKKTQEQKERSNHKLY